MDGFPTGFWGKFEGGKDDVPLRWHPLVDHCADVAAVAEALLQRTLIRQRLAKLAGHSDLDEHQVARLCVLAALHDVGKYNLGFQAKVNPRTPPTEKAGHVGEAIALLTGMGEASSQFLQALGIEDFAGWCSEETLFQLLCASICHHGRPLSTERSVLRWIWKKSGSLDPFTGIRELATKVREWFPLAFEKGGQPLPDDAAVAHAFSGLVMLADWIGSDEKTFPYRKPNDGERFSFAREQARAFLRFAGLDAEGTRASIGQIPSFSRVFSGQEPRPAQAHLAGLPLPESGGSLTILEAETGAGKTEAGLYRFLLLYFSGAVDGMYFALPTRTAATQIYRRVKDAIRRAFPNEDLRPPVVLAVPGYLEVDGIEGRPGHLSRFEVLWNDDEAERMRYRGWAAENTKRYLAAPIAIGTIDQVLLSSLRVSHAHLRATSLLRQFLVVDEVHASDAYMTRLLEVVLQRHLQAGGHALLMSATLGASSTSKFLGEPVPSFQEASASPFPAILHKDERVIRRATQGGLAKPVQLRTETSIADPSAVAALALDAARRGGKVLVIRNTVSDCIATQEALESLSEGDSTLLFRCAGVAAPHHARYSKPHREALDRAIEASFGKDRPGGGMVAIATQTVQQSLDLDADLLLTDLCPADVLLQRIGRLHRHERTREPAFTKAKAVVLVPKDRDLSQLIQEKGTVRGRHGLGTVYEDLRILEATWRCIEQRSLWQIPTDNRYLVEFATHPENLGAIVEELGDAWERHAVRQAGATAAVRGLAAVNAFSWQQPYSEQPFPSKIDDENIAARLGEGDRRIIFPQALHGPFAIPFQELTLPARWVREAEDKATPTRINVNDERIHFEYAGRHFIYDRLGLRTES